MQKLSLKAQQLATFYGAQEWLTETEQGQRYLYDIAQDLYNRISYNNNDNISTRLEPHLREIDLRLEADLKKAKTEEDVQKAYKLYYLEKQGEYDFERVHILIAETLEDLKSAMQTGNYKMMVILIDQLVAMSHHNTRVMDYAKEKNPEPSYTDQQVSNTFGFGEGLYDGLEEIMYQKVGPHFNQIAEASGALPEAAMGYNLRQRDWQPIANDSPEIKLDNVINILNHMVASFRHEQILAQNILAENPDAETGLSDKESRFNQTLAWIKAWLRKHYKNDELSNLMFSDLEKYGNLYHIFEPDYSENSIAIQLKKLFNSALNGDNSAYKLIKDMGYNHKFKLLSNFVQLMDSDKVRDVFRMLPIFGPLFPVHAQIKTNESLIAFIRRHRYLKNSISRYLTPQMNHVVNIGYKYEHEFGTASDEFVRNILIQ